MAILPADKNNDSKKVVILKEIRSWIIIIIVAISAAFLIQSKAFAKVTVQFDSMENTLYENQQLIINIIGYKFHKPERGDIITFFRYEEKGNLFDDIMRRIDDISTRINKEEPSTEHERLIKRVIGVEGDIIDIKDGYIYINQERFDEPYAVGETIERQIKMPVIVGKNELFVIGDNREVSIDSRHFGSIHIKQVEGKAVFRLFPFNEAGKLR